jgi:glycosyltransferase 2 family protein
VSTVAERGSPPTRERPNRDAQAVAGPESSFPIRRHPGDVLRVVAGGALLVLSAAIATTERVGTLERDLFRLINHLPSALEIPPIAVMQAGAIAAVPACAAVALIANRPRLARDLAVSGTTAWLLAKVVKDFVSRARPDALLSDVIVRTPATPASASRRGTRPWPPRWPRRPDRSRPVAPVTPPGWSWRWCRPAVSTSARTCPTTSSAA